jgi:hypothetical protein
VEGIKEEVVLSPAHALSLIASGEGICFFLVNTLLFYVSVIYSPPFLNRLSLWVSWLLHESPVVFVSSPRDLSSAAD